MSRANAQRRGRSMLACAVLLSAILGVSDPGRGEAPTILTGSAISRTEPPPHGEIGQSTVRRYTSHIKKPSIDVRERWFHPGSALGRHILTHDQTFYVLDGDADLQVDGVVHNLGTGDMIYAYAGSWVSLRPRGERPAKLLMVWAAKKAVSAGPAVIVGLEHGVRTEPTPWGRVGLSRVHEIFPPAADRQVEFRRRVYLPGARLGRHQIPRDVAIYVINGQGTLGVGEQSHDLSPGLSAYVPRENSIEIRQTGPEPLDLLMVWAAAAIDVEAEPPVLVNVAALAIEEPPHGGQGMSIVSRMSEKVPNREVELRLRRLLPGAAMAPYTVPRDQVLMVLDGHGELTVDGVSSGVAPDQFIYLREGSTFGLSQRADRPLSLLMLWAADAPVSRATWGPDVLLRESDWYGSDAARAMADNVLRYQSPQGGWPKSTDLSRSPATEANFPKPGDGRANSLDNDATTLPIEFLARVATATNDTTYRQAVEHGIDYLLAAQYDNGGWPQFFPLREGYYSHVTFNDNVMARVLNLLHDVASGQAPYTYIDPKRRAKASMAVDRGVGLILSTQLKAGGTLAGWAAQYDERSLEPAWARRYEPPSISGNESVGVVRFLMRQDRPSPRVVAAVEGAISWFCAVAIRDRRLDRFVNVSGDKDLRIIEDVGAPLIWARFHELSTSRPIFMGRDSVVRYNFAEVEHERRVGYGYLGTWPAKLLREDYPAWRAKWTPRGRDAAASCASPS
jgi:PelA/Pel-15E family pectate lyase